MTAESRETVPAAEPERLLLYDGTCGLCDRSVQFVLRNDPRGRFRFAALQSDLGQRILRENGMRTDDFDTAVLVEGGRVYTKSRAILRILRRLRAPWPALWPLVAVPRPISDWVYDRVAGNRYRFFGKYDACMIPPPEVRARFLDHP